MNLTSKSSRRLDLAIQRKPLGRKYLPICYHACPGNDAIKIVIGEGTADEWKSSTVRKTALDFEEKILVGLLWQRLTATSSILTQPNN